MRAKPEPDKKKAAKKKAPKKEQAVKPAVPAFLKPPAEKKHKSSKRPRNKGRS